MTETDRNANTTSHGTKKKNRALTTGKKGTAEPAVVSVECLTVQPQPQQSSQGNGSATPSPPGSNDDESNPQQGAPQQHQEQEPRPSSSPSHIETSTSTQPIAAGPSTPTTTTTTTTKIPPTIKDYRKIFVGGLPSDVTPEEFLQCFEQYGTVIDSVIMYDRITTRSRGFGFITFQNPQICQRLIQMKRIPMRSDKFVEIKEAQPRETTTQPNLTYTLHNKYRRGGDVGIMMPNAPFVPGMNHVMMGEPSMMEPSYMGMTYVVDMPTSPSVGRGLIDFTPYPATDIAAPPQFYSSNVHYSNNTLFVPDNTATSDEGQTDNLYVQAPPMSPSHVLMSYGEPYVPNFGMDESYISSTMQNGTSDQQSPNSRPPHLYHMPMPYYNSQYIPPPAEMPNNLGSPHRIIHPYDVSSMMPMSPTRSFYMTSSYFPTASFQPPFVDDSKMERSSPQNFFSSHDNVDVSSLHAVVASDENKNEESEIMTKTTLSTTKHPESDDHHTVNHHEDMKE